jgi:hypothetical protein
MFQILLIMFIMLAFINVPLYRKISPSFSAKQEKILSSVTRHCNMLPWLIVQMHRHDHAECDSVKPRCGMLDKVYYFILHKYKTQSECLCVTHARKHAYSVTRSNVIWCFHLSIKVYTNLHKNLLTLKSFCT